MRMSLSRQQIRNAVTAFLVDIILISILFLLLYSSVEEKKRRKVDTTCGIPILMWLEGFLVLFTIRSFSILFKIFVIRNYYGMRSRYELARIVFIDSFIVGWLIYGNELYFSKQNDCGDKESTLFLQQTMGSILFVGYVMMAFYLLLLCTIPCLYIYIQHLHANLAAQQRPGGNVDQR